MAELKDKELNEVVGGVNYDNNVSWNNQDKVPTDTGNYKVSTDVEINDIYIPLPSDEKLK